MPSRASSSTRGKARCFSRKRMTTAGVGGAPRQGPEADSDQPATIFHNSTRLSSEKGIHRTARRLPGVHRRPAGFPKTGVETANSHPPIADFEYQGRTGPAEQQDHRSKE